MGTVYGQTPLPKRQPDNAQTPRQRQLYLKVAERAADLRGQLETLVQIRRDGGYSSADVEVVRGAIFRAHDWR